MNSLITSYVRNKNRKTEEAFQAMDDARRILTDLEKVALDSAHGMDTDIGKTANLTHELRESVDRILVALVESAMLPKKEEA